MGPINSLQEGKLVWPVWNSMRGSSKIIMLSSNYITGYTCLKKMKSGCLKITLIPTITISKIHNQLQGPRTDEQMVKQHDICTQWNTTHPQRMGL